MNSKIILNEINLILADEQIHYFQEIVSIISSKYPHYNFSKNQIHYQLNKMIKTEQCKRICVGLYKKMPS